MKKEKNTNKKITFILNIMILIFAIILIYSGYKIVKWHIYNKRNEEIIEELTEKAVIKDDVVEESINFKEVLKKNNKTVGWIKVEGTTIDYPVVQASDNKYYLNHSFDNSYNEAGWVFMDYRNSKDKFDNNTIIYGHSMLNKTMFYTLRNIFAKDWLSNEDYHIVKYTSLKEETSWIVFSVYKIKAENYYITPKFNSSEEYTKWINDMKKRSVKNFDVEVNSDDKVLTLSSCYDNNNTRMVLHAKLIKESI